jgi:hypothetical protein
MARQSQGNLHELAVLCTRLATTEEVNLRAPKTSPKKHRASSALLLQAKAAVKPYPLFIGRYKDHRPEAASLISHHVPPVNLQWGYPTCSEYGLFAADSLYHQAWPFGQIGSGRWYPYRKFLRVPVGIQLHIPHLWGSRQMTATMKRFQFSPPFFLMFAFSQHSQRLTYQPPPSPPSPGIHQL